MAGQPDIRREVAWLALDAPRQGVNCAVVPGAAAPQSLALITADIVAVGDGSRMVVTVQLLVQARGMADGHRQGFAAGLDDLAGVAARSMVVQRVIKAPRKAVWGGAG